MNAKNAWPRRAPQVRRAKTVVMDRFAFLSAVSWLYPPPEQSVPPRGDAVVTVDGSVTIVVDGIPRRLPRHLALPPDLGGTRCDSPVHFGVANHPLHSDPAVVFDGCASVHFSEHEQSVLPPCFVDDVNNRDCGHPSGPVGAAAKDAVHMAFLQHDEWPDQAQFTCAIRIRVAEVEELRSWDGVARNASSIDSISRNCETRNTSWLEITLDGGMFVLDMTQVRHVVAGPPSDDRTQISSPPISDPHPSAESKKESKGKRGKRRVCESSEENKKQKRTQKKRDSHFGDDEASGDESDLDDANVDAIRSHPARKRKYKDMPPLLSEIGDGDVDVYTQSDGRLERRVSSIDDWDHHDSHDQNTPTPYITLVFSSCSLNLYHHPGVLGCHRASPVTEGLKIGAVRDTLVVFRDAARESLRSLHVKNFEKKMESNNSESRPRGRTSDNTLNDQCFDEENLRASANVVVDATVQRPRNAARAVCDAVLGNDDNVSTHTSPSRAAGAVSLALDASRSLGLRSALFTIEQCGDETRREGSNPHVSSNSLLLDAAVYAGLIKTHREFAEASTY